MSIPAQRFFFPLVLKKREPFEGAISMREILPDLALWRRVQEAHRGEAHPPRRTGEQVAAHLAARYPTERLDDAHFSEVVLANLREYPYALLPPEPRVRAFRVRREAAGAALYALVLDVASGKQTRTEQKGYREISIFKDGVVL